MKYIKILITSTLLIMACPDVAAQYGYGNPYSTGGVVDRRIDRQRDIKSSNKKKKAENEKPQDFVALTVDYFAKELKLDDFQKAAMRNVYEENKDALMSLNDLDIPYEAKKEKGKEISDRIDARIFPLLDNQQLAKYKELIEKRKT